MNFNKLIYQSKLLVKHYVNSGDHDWLLGAKKGFDPTKKECCGSCIKYLYVYQKLNATHEFPEWYHELIKERVQQIEDYFQESIRQILDEVNFDDEVDTALEKKNISLYKKKVNIYSTSIIDDLPLHLRLNVYLKLYCAEEDYKMICYLRNHLATTLAELGHLKLAQHLSLFNWAMAQEHEEIYFTSSHYLKTILESHKLESKHRLHWDVDKKASTLAQELCVYYEHLLTTNYTSENIATLDLVTTCYAHYPQLKEVLLPVKTYLRKKDKEEFCRKIEHLKKAFVYEHHELLLMDDENEQSCVVRDQFIIYKELLKIGRAGDTNKK